MGEVVSYALATPIPVLTLTSDPAYPVKLFTIIFGPVGALGEVVN